MKWVYDEVSHSFTCLCYGFLIRVYFIFAITSQAIRRAELFGIPGVTYSLTQVCNHPRFFFVFTF